MFSTAASKYSAVVDMDMLDESMDMTGSEEDRKATALIDRSIPTAEGERGEARMYAAILIGTVILGFSLYALFNWIATTVKDSNPTLGVVLIGLMGSGLVYALTRGGLFLWRMVFRPLLFTTVVISRDEPESSEVLDWVLYYMQTNELFNTKNSKATFKKRVKQNDRRSQKRGGKPVDDKVNVELRPDYLTHTMIFEGTRVYVSYAEGATLPMATEAVVKLDTLSLSIWSPCRNHSGILRAILHESYRVYSLKPPGVATVWYLDTSRWGASWMKYKEVRNPATNPFSAVFLPEELIQRIMGLCQDYIRREDDDNTSILGFLLHGKPGQGKSYFLQMLAVALKKDLCYLPLGSGSMDDASLIKAFADAPPDCIFLMEDIDNVHAALHKGEEGPKRNASDKHITVSTLLNILSGPLCKGGIVFGTTNYPDKLLPSLTRSGRLGHVFQFGDPNDGSIRKALSFFYPSVCADEASELLRRIRTLEQEASERSHAECQQWEVRETERQQKERQEKKEKEKETQGDDELEAEQEKPVSIMNGHKHKPGRRGGRGEGRRGEGRGEREQSAEKEEPPARPRVFSGFTMATISSFLREEARRGTSASDVADRIMELLQAMLKEQRLRDLL